MKKFITREKTKRLFTKIMAAFLTALFCVQSGSDFSSVTTVLAEETDAEIYEAGDCETAESITDAWNEAADELAVEASSKDIMAVVYLTNGYDVKSAASSDADTVITVSSGQTVYIIGTEDAESFDENNANLYSVTEDEIWYLVSFYLNDNSYTGYVKRENLAVSDEIFLKWEENTFSVLKSFVCTGTDTNTLLSSSDSSTTTSDNSSVLLGDSASGSDSASVSSDNSSDSVTYADVEAFPESYRKALYALKEEHPDWIFVVLDTGLDWDTSVTTESSISGNRSWIQNSNYYYHASQTVLQGSWYYASKETVAYYMDPRNFLNETRIFMFEQQSYNASYHTVEGVETMLSGTFMDSSNGNAPGTDETYAQIIYEVGKELNVSPYSLASRIIQEQGSSGNSALISGTYSGYEGYYNYFNVGASGTTDAAVITSGLTYAKNQGWTDAKKSIAGGASTIAKGYIAAGQDTVYLEKFNVAPSDSKNLYGHQYMQNVQAPYSESYTTRKQYENSGCLDKPFVFKIPVYDDMPAYASPMPQEADFKIISSSFDGSVTLNYYVYFPSILRNNNLSNGSLKSYSAYVYFSDSDGNYIGGIQILYNDENTYYDYDTGYYKFNYNLSAKDMTKEIVCHFVYHKIDNSGNDVGTDTIPASITLSFQDYMEQIINTPDDYADYVDTAKSLLYYGGAVQRYFGYNTDSCADSILNNESSVTSQVLTENDIAELNKYACKYEDDSSACKGYISFLGASLILESNISVKMYYRLSDEYLSTSSLNSGGMPENLTAVLTDGDSSGENLSISVIGNIAVVTVSDIGLSGWGDYFNVKISDSSNGVSYSVDYCPLSYCNSIVQSGSTSDTLEALAKAMLSLYES